MKCTFVLFISTALVCMTACGGGSSKPGAPDCNGVLVSGILQDSLTNQPIAQGWAVLESGAELSTTPVYNFFPKQRVAADSRGAFELCSTTLTMPSAIVIVALDSSGKAYPPFVAPISGSVDLGPILMGGCRGTCGFEGQQQTSLPATINGVITSAPIAKRGAVVPQYVMNGLDGSKNLWALTMPIFNAAQPYTFSSQSGICPAETSFCDAYTFTVPSQRPIQRVNGGYLQETAAPDYVIYAAVDGAPSCIPPFTVTIFQQNGTSFLTGTPGIQLSAENIEFNSCQ